MLKKIFHEVINLFFPAACPACGRHLEYPLVICENCSIKVISKRGVSRHSSPRIDDIISLRPYEGAVKDCLQILKYHKKEYFISIFREIIMSECRGNFFPKNSPDMIIPVPLYYTRRIQRGFNQSEMVSDILSGLLNAPSRSNVLIKVKNTRAQTGLSREKRKMNLKNAFAVRNKSSIKGKNVLLVDDIFTTGATLDSCAKELIKAGARKVSGFTIAKTP